MKGYYAALPPPETKGFINQQTMWRVKDPIRSLDFYTQVLGMNLIWHKDFPQYGFSVYFVSPCVKDQIPSDENERFQFCLNTPGCLELTWNHGSETEGGDRVYNTGNGDSLGSGDGQKVRGGFGHFGISVPCVYEACERFHQLGVEFTKSPNGGGMKGLAFIKDPDGYLIEIVPQQVGSDGGMPTKSVDCLGTAIDGGGYTDNQK